MNAFISVRATQHPPLLEQVVLAAFITEGHFARHIRRTRALYAKRQDALVEAAKRDLAGLLEIQSTAGGMHLLGWLPDSMDDRTASQCARAHGVVTSPLSAYSIETGQRGALLLGYAGIDEREIEAGVRRLAYALRQYDPAH